MKPDKIVTSARRMMRAPYAHCEISQYEMDQLLTIWAESHGLLDFEPSRVHSYQDQSGKTYVHFYGPNQLPGKDLFEDK